MINFKFRIFSVLLLLAGFSFCYAQQVQLSGSVTDTINQPLQNANILAFPQNSDAQTRFAITSPEGRYRIKLDSDVPYRIEASYLGFQKITKTINLSQDSIYNFTMLPASEQLGEVKLTQKIAVKVREDTITYRTDAFKTGEERKLRDILKKLPGVEIDRDGNATVNGKEVTKLMVEGKDFFTGDEKLGVNNIPADAVDEVEAIDNYNEVAFLKGLSDSDKLVLNIKLKEGKKKFAFGDVEAGGGVKDRYLLYPKVFYYSPKTTVNLIGDLNNTGQKSFTFSDYINFEGGFLSLMDKGASSYGELSRDNFAQFLNNEDFVFNRNQFGALSLAQQLSSSTDLEGYAIVNNARVETRQEGFYNYLSGNRTTEQRTVTDRNELFFTLGKLRLRHRPNSSEDFYLASYIKTNHGDGLNQITSQSSNQNTFVNAENRPESVDFKTEMSYNKQFSYKHTSTLESSYSYLQNLGNRDWLFDRPVFSGIVPFADEDGTYNLLQDTKVINGAFNLKLKHYWVLHRFHHIYPEVGFQVTNQRYNSTDAQRLNNGGINDFTGAGFNNDLDFGLNDTYFGFQYKVKVSDFIFKPGIFYHNYLWSVDQQDIRQVSNTKAVILPELLVELELDSGEKFRLNYNRESQFGNATQLADRFRLTGFNSLFQGNANLENELSNAVRLSFSKFSLYRGITLYAGLSYRNRERSIRSTTLLEGIDQIATLIYTELPENSYGANGNFSKKIKDYRFSVGGNLNINDYSRNINTSVIDYNSVNYGYNLKVETFYDTWPNMEIGLRHSFSDFSSDTFSNSFSQIKPYAVLEYDFWNDFILKTDYDYTYYKNKDQNQINRFQEANASLYYNKEGSAWGFEVEARNLFNIRFRTSNSFDQFLILDQLTFVQPRMVVFKVSYKL